MFDPVDLDVGAACAAIEATETALRELEWRQLRLAAHWAVLHDGATLRAQRAQRAQGAGRGSGSERVKRVGGDGTPVVAEFGCAELATLLGCGYVAADNLIHDAVDLQFRHPVLWAGLGQGRGRVWKARKVARMTYAAGLSLEQARWGDARVADYVDSLPWSRFLDLVAARIIEVDPAAAEARRLAAEMERFVCTGQSNEHGLKTLIARAQAGEVIVFVAMCDRIADLLLLEGDQAPVGVRRSRALGVLANPARALLLLEKYATPQATDPGPDPDTDDQPGDQPDDQPDDQPGDQPSDQPRGEPVADADVNEPGSGSGRDPDEPDWDQVEPAPDHPDDLPAPCPACG